MHLRPRPDHGLDDPTLRPNAGECSEHAWRIRDVTYALPGIYICEVCQRCGALNISGPEEFSGVTANRLTTSAPRLTPGAALSLLLQPEARCHTYRMRHRKRILAEEDGRAHRGVPASDLRDQGVPMRLWPRVNQSNRNDGPDPDTCGHTWRLRDVSVALPGPYVCEVCDRCGALRLHGPEAITGPPSHVADGAATHLESVARQAARQASSPLPRD